MDGWLVWGIWALLLIGLLFLSSFLEKKAALRGSHRVALSPWIDKGIRAFFLLIMMWPLVALLGLPIIGCIFVLYLPLYLDGSEKRGRPSNLLKQFFVFQWIIDYFQISWDAEVDPATGKPFVLNPKQQYIIGIHPHGILPVPTMTNVLSGLSDMNKTFINEVKVRTLAASACFLIPIYRDFLLAGGVIDAARYNARAALDEGFSVAVVPGGASEALVGGPGDHAVLIKKRKGFVKLALETGSSLVPCYSFGENELYGQLRDSLPVVKTIQKKFQAVFGISLPMVSNIFPRRARVVTVAARPIPVKKVEKPTDEQVQALLDVYIDSLQRIFAQFSDKYVPVKEHRKLTVF